MNFSPLFLNQSLTITGTDSFCDGEQLQSIRGSSVEIIDQIDVTLESPLELYNRPIAEMERFFKLNTPWGTDPSKFNAPLVRYANENRFEVRFGGNSKTVKTVSCRNRSPSSSSCWSSFDCSAYRAFLSVSSATWHFP